MRTRIFPALATGGTLFNAAAAGLLLMTAACNLAQQTGLVLSPADLAALRDTCAAAAPALRVATNPAAPAPLSATAVYPAAFCQQLLAGAVPPTTNSSSPAWLGQTLAITQDIATAAGVILPIALKVLPLVAAVL